MNKSAQRVVLHMDLTSIIDEYQPTENLLAAVSLNTRDLVISTVNSMLLWEHTKAPVLDADKRLPHQRLVDLVCDQTLYGSADPTDYSSSDFNDICRIVRAIVLHTYVYFSEFFLQFNFTDTQRESVDVIHWKGKTLILECDES